MLLTIRLILLALLVLYILFVLLAHLHGRVRLRFDRQLVDHSALFAPYNVLMYAFSATPALPILNRRDFPELDVLQENWQTIRDEALRLTDEGFIRSHNEAAFSSFFKQGWQRFYIKWYGDPLPSAEKFCPKTLALINSIPNLKAALFTTLAPNSKLNAHRDPCAGSLRYHLGLKTPNSPDCRIVIDGEPYAWGDGKDIVFDETYVHWVENKTDQSRIIFFADFDRPLRSRLLTAFNRRVGIFMGRITASPNIESPEEKTGFVNRVFIMNRRGRERISNFRHSKPTLFRTIKYIGIVVLVWLIFLAPWPFSS